MKLTPPPITPGPWNHRPTHWAGGSDSFKYGKENCPWINADGKSDIARVNPFGAYANAEDMANARAIAALPKVLEALEDLLENLDETGLATMPGDTFENMRETIERAKDALLEAGYTISEP